MRRIFLVALALRFGGCAPPPAERAPDPPMPGYSAPEPEFPGRVSAPPLVHWFTDVTAGSGISLVGTTAPPQQPQDPLYMTATFVGNGATAGDVDGDGLIDLVVAGGYGAPAVLYRNLGGLHFEASALLASAIGAALADLDGDGDPDLVLVDVGGCVIYENLGGGVLTARMEVPGFGAVGALPADFDGDGLLDLLFYAHAPQMSARSPGGRLLRNQGGFAFADVTEAWGLVHHGMTWAAAAFDWDGDGAVDLYLANDTGTPDTGSGTDPARIAVPVDALFRNGPGSSGSRHFVDVAATAGLDAPRSSMNVLVEDFDADGRFDLFVSNWGRNPLLVAGSAGTYADATNRFGLSEVRMQSPSCPAGSTIDACLLTTWGAARFDVDHDGFDDLVVVRGNVFRLPEGEEQPAAAWRGDGAGGLTRVDPGLGWLAARALVPVDLDGDGDLDLVVTQHGGVVRLFRNDAPAAHGWLRVRLQGNHSNRDGVGAVVVATLESGRQIRRVVGAGGLPHSWAPAEAHFVTGGEKLQALEIRWPAGTVQVLANVTLDRILSIAEP